MTTYVIPLPPPVTLPVFGRAERFPVQRVFCVGRNYAAHAREMGGNPETEKPFFFIKPAQSVVHDGSVAYPARTADYHHEVELVVALAAGGRDIPVSAALGLVYGYGVGLDLTRRDVQAELKKAGRPWEMGKCPDQGAPVSALVPASDCGHPNRGRIALTVNGELRQEGDLADMILDVPHIIAELSTWFTLLPGDLILTGTPEGVGPLQRGDQLHASVAGVTELDLRLV